MLVIFGIRLTEFWFRFSGTDRKKLYMVSEAAHRFNEYRSAVVTEFLLYNINELISFIAFLTVGSTLIYGWNKENYDGLFYREDNWTTSIIYAFITQATTLLVSISAVAYMALRLKPKAVVFLPFLEWTRKNTFFIIVHLTYALLLPYQLLLDHNGFPLNPPLSAV